MIDVSNLTKWYGPTCAVDDLTFQIPKGQIVGFLGPNGAGKSTTLRMLTGFLPPTNGTIRINECDVLTDSQSARAAIGYQPENTPLYPEMRVAEYLHYRGKLFGMDREQRRQRIDIVCDRCGLEQVRNRVIGNLSKGNRQRVGLAQAMLHDPPVLILDEPTAGLDPNQIRNVRQLIAELKGQHTIMLSTHILQEVEQSADRVMIIANGKIVAEGAPDELRRSVAEESRIVVEVKASSESVNKAFASIHGVESLETTSIDGWTTTTVSQDRGTDVREALGQAVASNNWVVREMRYETASLERFFSEVTAKQDQAGAEES